MNMRKELFRRMWEKGFEMSNEGKSADITFDTRREAERIRLSLYTSIRKFRENAALDPDFHDKLQQLECVIDEVDGKFILRIRHVALNPAMQKAAAQLGLLMTPDEDEAEAIARRLMENGNAQHNGND